MMVASWNVNSIKVRLEQVLEWLDSAQPDVLGLQELKMQTESFPVAAFEELGYHCAIEGQKTYNGVALLSRHKPEEVTRGIPNFSDEQKRAIAATYKDRRVINLYIPNGQAVGSEKYNYKLNWLAALTNWIEQELAQHKNLIIMGDFNIAPDDRDVHDPNEWQGKILCSDAERAALQKLLALGLNDSFRLFDQPAKTFSWWDYRAAGFRRNRGMRIDLLLVSDALSNTTLASRIDTEPRGHERPSDHAPVWAELS
ncbi:MAG: exodeoxyribonuclease III [Gammaproteobacteria bacterium]|nr:exodeoxyribonuclease III [Gammaproteobacteria bacterium]MCP4090177.1 exodeoxyribonuclease III [Gammaproteobacteria bacterium]MCP4277948.1 exodeoxyribonuclease III [Gammaproteobacteria bacterium]MCP4832543.1 exodeoxyribonuclease III [Gammaproteobacteria bacterium]MCP4928675.1 exodeoxyribonuclease III [Gammaproteobacteria bacterium]